MSVCAKEMNELTNELMKLKYPKSHSRKNVMNDGDKSYEAFVLGLVHSWAHKKTKEEPGACIRPNINTNKPKFAKVKYLAEQIAEDFGAEFTTIQFNKNYQCAKHIDGKNTGISHIIGLGNYEGGELLIYYDGRDAEPTSVDIRNRFYSFDGSAYFHETSPFTGERHTLVFFSVG